MLMQVSRERIRVLEFMQDYDKLRSGWIPLTLFHRVLDICGFSLSPFEVAALGQRSAYVHACCMCVWMCIRTGLWIYTYVQFVE